MSKKKFLYLKLVLVTVFWGGTFLTGQITSKAISPVLGAFGRFLAASLFLAVVLPLREREWPRINRRQALLILAGAATGIVSYNLFFFSGLKLIETNRASLIVALNPVMIMLMASMVRMERLTVGRVIGILVALFGVSIVLTRGNLSEIQHRARRDFDLRLCDQLGVVHSDRASAYRRTNPTGGDNLCQHRRHTGPAGSSCQ